jgi:palmitoyltransferase ZDHHC13/17
VVNAVGAQNHHFFLGFLLSAVVAITLHLVGCWWYLQAQDDVIYGRGVLVLLWSLVHFQPLLVCVAALALLHDLWIGYLLFFHIYLACAALTTNEVVKNENLERAYSRGVVQNVLDFVGLGAAVDWRTIYRLDDFVARMQGGGDKKQA